MQTSPFLLPMLAHIIWIVFLYALLTLVRAPTVWKIGLKKDGSDPLSVYEPRVSANLKNQFEWPVIFYTVSILLIVAANTDPLQPALAWLFVAGRILHSGVQILTDNVRLRGIIFTVNFVSVLVMWGLLLAGA
jgi:hypothetical protein